MAREPSYRVPLHRVLWERLAAIRKQEGVSITAQVRMAVERWLAAREGSRDMVAAMTTSRVRHLDRRLYVSAAVLPSDLRHCVIHGAVHPEEELAVVEVEHPTGVKRRGVLCRLHATGLMAFADDPRKLAHAIAFLEGNAGKGPAPKTSLPPPPTTPALPES